MRALPNMLTAGRMPRRRSVATDEFCHNAEHPPRFLTVGRVHRLWVDQLGNLVCLDHAEVNSGRRFVVSVSRLSRAARSAQLARRADRRDRRRARHAAPIGRGRQAGLQRLRVRRQGQDLSRRLVSGIQGELARRCPTTWPRRSSRCTS